MAKNTSKKIKELKGIKPEKIATNGGWYYGIKKT